MAVFSLLVLLVLSFTDATITMTLFEEDMAIVCMEKLGQQSSVINVQRAAYTGVSFDLKPSSSASLGECNGIFTFEITPDANMTSNTTLTFSDQKMCLITLARIGSSSTFDGEFQGKFDCNATPPSITYTLAASTQQSGARLISLYGFPLESISITFNNSVERTTPSLPPFQRCDNFPAYFGFSTFKSAGACQAYVLTQPTVIAVACLIDGQFDGTYFVAIEIDDTSGPALNLNMTGCHNVTYVSASPPAFFQRTFIWDFGSVQACRSTLYTITSFDQYNNSTMEFCTNEFEPESSSMVMEFNAANSGNQTSFASITTASEAPYFPIQSLTITYPVAYEG